MAVSPFKTGQGLILQAYKSNQYLDSNVNAVKSKSVFLNDNIGPGSHWEVIVIPFGRICFRTVTTSVKKHLIDSSAAADRNVAVYLGDEESGAGSHWSPYRFSGIDYSFKCDSPSGKRQYLCYDPTASQEDSVYLEESNATANAHWNILVTHYIGDSVHTIISAAYPSVPISSCEPNSTYGSLEYDRLHSIWKDTQLGDNQMTPIANNFTVCLKAEVYKHSYDSDSPWPNDKGSICGIMWGSIGGKMCALNFTIDPFQNLILFDSQNGQKIATDKFIPTFCMV